MIDDKKIEEATERQLNNLGSYGLNEDELDKIGSMVLYREEDVKESFKTAINWFLNNLWHPASEEPRKDVSIIVETHNDKNMFYYAWNRWQDNFYPSWTDAVLCSRVSRWLYIDDLFPKKGCEQ